MDVLLVAMNAKYIHTNNAVRLLKANSVVDCDYIDFTIHDSLDDMLSIILKINPKIIGFSCYIWNIEKIKLLTKLIKAHSNIPIILGGPEVSYDATYFLSTLPVDVIVKGEGEHVFDSVVHDLLNHNPISATSNVSFKEKDKLIHKPIGMIKDLNTLKSPYYFEADYPHLPKRIAYIESSRGCPYKCSYCLSSLEKGVRFFDTLRVQSDILHLLKHGVKTFKFLDRTFNASKHMIPILAFIIEHAYPDTVFQFEITGDILDEKILEYIHKHAKKGLFRFEIGIQSTNEHTNMLVDRIQNNDKLFSIIKTIQAHDIIDLHLDLIAGLPEEDLASFTETFNTVYALNAKELQLGFLKMLRGTKIRNQADLYQYKYDALAPYEITENACLSNHDMSIIKSVEEALNLFHNKGFFGDLIYNLAMHNNNPFEFFYTLSEIARKSHFDFHRYQLHEVFILIENYIKHMNNSSPLIDMLRLHYLKRAKVKPHLYFDVEKDKQAKKTLFEPLAIKYNLSINDLFKHSVVYNNHIIYYHNHQAISL